MSILKKAKISILFSYWFACRDFIWGGYINHCFKLYSLNFPWFVTPPLTWSAKAPAPCWPTDLYVSSGGLLNGSFLCTPYCSPRSHICEFSSFWNRVTLTSGGAGCYRYWTETWSCNGRQGDKETRRSETERGWKPHRVHTHNDLFRTLNHISMTKHCVISVYIRV